MFWGGGAQNRKIMNCTLGFCIDLSESENTGHLGNPISSWQIFLEHAREIGIETHACS
jgi:RNA binding exosome subunit